MMAMAQDYIKLHPDAISTMKPAWLQKNNRASWLNMVNTVRLIDPDYFADMDDDAVLEKLENAEINKDFY